MRYKSNWKESSPRWSASGAGYESGWMLSFPVGYLLLLPGVLWLLVALRRALRTYNLRFRHRRGLCLACGYDLRGNESGNCPECGTEVKA